MFPVRNRLTIYHICPVRLYCLNGEGDMLHLVIKFGITVWYDLCTVYLGTYFGYVDSGNSPFHTACLMWACCTSVTSHYVV